MMRAAVTFFAFLLCLMLLGPLLDGMATPPPPASPCPENGVLKDGHCYTKHGRKQ